MKWIKILYLILSKEKGKYLIDPFALFVYIFFTIQSNPELTHDGTLLYPIWKEEKVQYNSIIEKYIYVPDSLLVPLQHSVWNRSCLCIAIPYIIVSSNIRYLIWLLLHFFDHFIAFRVLIDDERFFILKKIPLLLKKGWWRIIHIYV